MIRGIWRWLWWGSGATVATVPTRVILTAVDCSRVTLNAVDASRVILTAVDCSRVTLNAGGD